MPRSRTDPTAPNPRTLLPSHLGPTLERIDELLDFGGLDVSHVDELTANLVDLDSRMQEARGHVEVLSLLLQWRTLTTRTEEDDGAMGHVPKSRAHSRSWPSMPPLVEVLGRPGDMRATPARLRTRSSALLSPRHMPRILCALDVREEYGSTSSFDMSLYQRLELRILTKAAAILLDALLASLLRHAEHVIGTRDHWDHYADRPMSYIVWCGPRLWARLAGAPDSLAAVVEEPSEKVAALTELLGLMQTHIGRVHTSIMDYRRVMDRGKLHSVTQAATETLQGLLSPPSQSASPELPGPEAWRLEAHATVSVGALRTRLELCAQNWRSYGHRLSLELGALERPGHIGRNWLRYSVAGAALAVGSLWLWRSGVDNVRQVLHGLTDSLAQWWSEHLRVPLSYMYGELVNRRYVVVSDAKQLDDARRSLEIMVQGFVGRHSRKLHPTSKVCGVDEQLEAISRLFEKQAGPGAIYNLISGDLVEIMWVAAFGTRGPAPRVHLRCRKPRPRPLQAHPSYPSQTRSLLHDVRHR